MSELRRIGMSDATRAMLSVSGSAAVVLRTPAGNDGGAAAIGLAEVAWQDAELEPVLVKWRGDAQATVVVEAETLETIAGDDPRAALLGTARVVIAGRQMKIVGVEAEYAGSRAYLYRLKAEE